MISKRNYLHEGWFVLVIQVLVLLTLWRTCIANLEKLKVPVPTT